MTEEQTAILEKTKAYLEANPTAYCLTICMSRTHTHAEMPSVSAEDVFSLVGSLEWIKSKLLEEGAP